MIEAELEALGSDYRANGYTTGAQADDLGRRLGLRAGDRLLDIGAGCGWPGLYLARTTGCRVVSIDPVGEAATATAERAGVDELTARHQPVVGSGEHLPFRSGRFDAVLHTDVTC